MTDHRLVSREPSLTEDRRDAAIISRMPSGRLRDLGLTPGALSVGSHNEITEELVALLARRGRVEAPS